MQHLLLPRLSHINKHLICRNLVEEFRKSTMMYTKAFCCVLYLTLIFFNFLANLLLLVSEYNSDPYEEFDTKRNRTVLYKQIEGQLYLPFNTSGSDGYFILKFLLEVQIECALVMTFIGKSIFYLNQIWIWSTLFIVMGTMKSFFRSIPLWIYLNFNLF